MKEEDEIIVNLIDDFGIETIDNIGHIPINEHERKIDELMDAIMPFLNNLMKDPNKDIHWPNRDKIIQKFILKLEKIAYGNIHVAEN